MSVKYIKIINTHRLTDCNGCDLLIMLQLVPVQLVMQKQNEL